MVTSTQLPPESLVARIIEEIESNPEAQRLLLRALLTEEFLRVPERLDRIEAELAEAKADRADIREQLAEAKADRADIREQLAEAKADRADIREQLAEAKADRADIRAELEVAKTERAQMRDDIGMLKGDMLEVRLHRRIRSLVSQRLGLRRGRIMQSLVQETRSDFSDAVEGALANDLITDNQESRIDATDIILRAVRKSDGARVWIAVEASNNVGRRDIERARETADALGAAFGEEAEAVVAGYSIHTRDSERADTLGVHAFIVPIPGLPSDSE